LTTDGTGTTCSTSLNLLDRVGSLGKILEVTSSEKISNDSLSQW
jgi:ACT domain-containing protein